MIEEHRCGYNVSNYPDFSNAPKLRPEFLRFGYVVRVETGKAEATYGMVVLVGDFEKRVIFDRSKPPQEWPYCASLEDVIDRIDIVYGFDSCYSPLRLSAIGRPILWRKRKTVKMTMSEICKKLGYDVEIIKEENE